MSVAADARIEGTGAIRGTFATESGQLSRKEYTLKKTLFLVAILVFTGSAMAQPGGVSVDQSNVLDRWTVRLGG